MQERAGYDRRNEDDNYYIPCCIFMGGKKSLASLDDQSKKEEKRSYGLGFTLISIENKRGTATPVYGARPSKRGSS